MIFSSPYFLFLYFPIVLTLYYISPLRWRNPVLLIVNLIFYGWGEPVYVLIMFLSIAIAAATPLGKILWRRLPERARLAAFPVLMLAGLVFTTAYLVDGTYNPFLYFRF